MADWLQQVQNHELDGLEHMQERIRKLETELDVASLPEDIQQIEEDRAGGEEELAERRAEAAVDRLQTLAEELDRERRRLTESHLERLTQAEAETRQLDEALQQPEVPVETMERLMMLTEDLEDLNDEALDRLVEELKSEIRIPGQEQTNTPQAGGDELTLKPIAARLRDMINRIIENELLINRDSRVPARYNTLVERYYKALSDDLPE